MRAIGLALALAVLCAGPAFADGPDETTPVTPPPAATQPATTTPQPAATQAEPAAPAAQPTAGPVGRSGTVAMPAGDLNLTVPTSYLYYGPDVARAHLTQIGAPAPAGEILGLLAPRDSAPGSADFWGAVVTYQPIGHVGADTASGLSENGFERSVRDARAAAGRPFESFETAPAFAPASSSVSWVERSARANAQGPTVRHEQRLLGRNGVAGQTIVARDAQLGQIKAAAPSMLAMMSFTPGQAYSDFNSVTDAPSTYTVPGLITNVATVVADTASVAGPNGTPAKAASTTGGGQTNYLPWLLGGLALVGGLAWLALGNRRKEEDLLDDDPNIAPKRDEL